MENGLDTEFGEKIADAGQVMLACEEDHFAMKQAAEQMYAVFSEITGVSSDDLTTGEIMLPSGKAISPGAAAHCLLEYKRTAVFLRGIRQAIDTVLATGASPVRILYAGCGPYATLISPLLHRYSPDRLQVDLLDINPAALTAVRTVSETLDLTAFVGGYLLEDAATWQVPEGSHYDILLSETMQACLDHEPQVTILENLVGQLPKEVVVIPESVVVDARLLDPKQEQDRLFYSEIPKLPPERIHLGEVFILRQGQLTSGERNGEVSIPPAIGTCVELKLFTSITVFGDHFLNENNSSLNMPKKFYDFSRSQYARRIRFEYDRANGPLTKIACRVMEYAPGEM